MRKMPILAAGMVLLSGCAQMAPKTENAGSAGAAVTAAKRARMATEKAEEAERRLETINVRREATERRFCPGWRKSLLLARRDAVGCARTRPVEQQTCWQAVSGWATEESRYYSALHGLLAENPPYAKASSSAARFFALAGKWALVCENGSPGCVAAPQRNGMHQQRQAISAFCAGVAPEG